MKTECVLVTGTSGYLGSLIAEKLISEGYEVIGLDIIHSDRAGAISADYRFMTGDITQPETLPLELRRASVLIHCAALVHRKSTDLSRENYFKINCEGSRNILLALDPNRLRRVIFMSTVSVYGKIKSGTIPDERTPPEPMDFYGESKIAAEEEVRAFSRKYAIFDTIFRLAPVYGRYFLLNLEKRVFLPKRIAFYKIGDGHQRLSAVSAENVTNAVYECLKGGKEYNGIFNLKDKEDYSINDIISTLRRIYKQPRRPLIKIPRTLLLGTASIMKSLIPAKGSFFSYQLQKISGDAIYSGSKLLAAGINLPWNLTETLLGNATVLDIQYPGEP